ncbi:hypothetical protein GCM10028796_17070 [Ramlibacter monticola]|uniref:Uncharacterized protein n=1 Tax=Ramlibacter monticola TaxID=1926872 RepID=A0A936YW17_9BURK|nr:hypothetical protein [Ramlibacter monticola]MBL0390534.1 hypothetical protein [Ramlibacter monticola]
MIQIKFTKFGAHSAFGGFAPGDTMRAPDALARHLVEEAQVAEYVQPKAPAPAPQPAEAPAPAPTPTPRKVRSK